MEAKVHQLSIAYDKAKNIFTGEPAVNELHHETDIAQNWPIITISYSGLEQTIKYLIAEQENLEIDDLVNYKTQSEKYVYRTHDLAFLYSKLNRETKEIIEEYYCDYSTETCHPVHAEGCHLIHGKVATQSTLKAATLDHGASHPRRSEATQRSLG